MAHIAKRRGWVVALGGLLALFFISTLHFLAYLLVAVGLPQRSLEAAAWAAPLCGVALGGLALRSWRRGALVGIGIAALWLVGWLFLMGRFDPRLWWLDGLPRLTPAHFGAWALTLLAGALGGLAGGTRKRRTFTFALAALYPISLLVFTLCTADPPRELTLAPGAVIRHAPPAPDGTTVTLLTLDCRANPRLYLGLFDADFADAVPHDNRNASWLGQSVRLAWPALQRQAAPHGRLLYACNGGFFGFDKLLVGWHIIPLAADGRAHYPPNTMRFQDQVWHFGMRETAAGPRFALVHDRDWVRNHTFETALGGVRPLRQQGKSVALAPGNGNTTLRCSRTSVGWLPDSSKLFILIVTDLDGEFGSIAQRARGAQTGGMDLRQLQQFWEAQGVPDAVLFDGGESTQCAYRLPGGGLRTVRSAYLLSKTLGYVRGHPLRACVPMLPPAQSYNGVMNYLYVSER